jgi:hypothetical protein
MKMRRFATSGNPMADFQWHHVAVTYGSQVRRFISFFIVIFIIIISNFILFLKKKPRHEIQLNFLNFKLQWCMFKRSYLA